MAGATSARGSGWRERGRRRAGFVPGPGGGQTGGPWLLWPLAGDGGLGRAQWDTVPWGRPGGQVLVTRCHVRRHVGPALVNQLQLPDHLGGGAGPSLSPPRPRRTLRHPGRGVRPRRGAGLGRRASVPPPGHRGSCASAAGIYILIAVGAVMMFVGFLGCYGAIQESQCLLGTVRPGPRWAAVSGFPRGWEDDRTGTPGGGSARPATGQRWVPGASAASLTWRKGHGQRGTSPRTPALGSVFGS